MTNEYVIRIVLKARDELSAALTHARQQIAALSGEELNLPGAEKAAEDVKRVGTEAKATAATVKEASRSSVADLDKVNESTKRLRASAGQLEASFKKYRQEMRDGKKDADDAVFSLNGFANAFAALSRQFDVGSQQAEYWNRQRMEAERGARGILDARKKLADDDAAVARRVAKQQADAEKAAVKATQQAAKEQKSVVEQQQREREAAAAAAARRVERNDREAQRAAEQRRRQSERDAERQRQIDERNRSAREQQARQYAALRRAMRELDDEVERGNISGDQARAGYRRLANELNTLSRKYDATGKAARALGEDAERARVRVAELGHEAGNSGTYFDRWQRSVENSHLNVARLDNNLRGFMVLGIATFAQQLISAFTALAGSLVSVASSAGAAGAALGGAFVAGASQAIPVAGLLAAALHRVGMVGDALKQADLVRQQQFARSDQMARRAAGATDAVAGAQEALGAAQDRVGESQRRLNLVRADAVRQLQDIINAEREAELAARGAALSQEEAQARLASTIASGDTGAIARARLAVDESASGVAATSQRLDRARQDADRARSGGVEGMESVRSARRDLSEAQRSVAGAQRSVENARRQSDNASAEALASVGKLNYLLERELSASERRLFRSVERFQDTYKSAMRPITDIIVDSFSRTVDRGVALLEDPRVTGALEGLSERMATGMDRVVDAFTDDRTIGRLAGITDEAGRNMEPLTDAAISFGDALLDIAEHAQPIFRDIVGWVRDFAVGLDEITSDDARMDSFFGKVREHLRSWKDLAQASIELIFAIAGEAAPSGKSAVDDLTEQIKRGTDWIKTHQSEVRQFFEDAREATAAMASMLWGLGKAIMDIFDPGGVKNFANVLRDVVLPAVKDVVETLGFFTDLLLIIVGNPMLSGLASLALKLGLIFKTLKTIEQLVFSAKVAVLGKEASAAGPAVLGLKGHFGALSDVVSGAAGHARGIGAAIKTLLTTGSLTQAKDAFSAMRKSAEATAVATRRTRTNTTSTARTGSSTTVVNPDGSTTVIPAGAPGGPDAPPSRRSRNLRRAGIVGAIAGGIGIGEIAKGGTLPTDFSFGTRADLTSKDLSQTFQRLLSADPFAAVKAAGRDQDKIIDFSKHFEENFNWAVGQKNVKFLQAMAGEARTLAAVWPEFNDQLAKYSDIADDAAEKTRDLAKRQRELLGPEKDVKKGFWANTYLRGLDRLAKEGPKSIEAVRKGLDVNVEAIQKGFKPGSESATTAMARNFGAGIKAIKDGMRDGTISTADGMKEIERITYRQMRNARRHMSDYSAEGRKQLSANMKGAADAVRKHMRDAEGVTEDGMRIIRDLLADELSAYGIDKKTIKNVTSQTTDRNTAFQLAGRADGGFVGQQGERGRDSLAHLVNGRPVGRGEAVLNWAQQQYIEPAVNSFYGHGLADTFKRVRGLHAGGYGQMGYAGGFAGKSPAGYATVPIPGFPGEFIAQRVLREALALVRRFHLGITDGFAASGHKGAGHLRYGTAIDVVPGRGGSWDSVDSAVAYARSKGLTVLYDGVPGHGRGNHAHIELMPGVMGAIGGMLGKLIPRQRVKGPDSALKTLAQGALDMARRGANRRLRQETAGGDGTWESHGVEGTLSRREAAAVISRAMGLVGVPMELRSQWRSMALDRAFQESRFNPNAVNNWDSNAKAGTPSIGFMQTIGPTFAANAIPGMNNIRNPLHNSAAAFRYMLNRYGHGDWEQALRAMLGRRGVGYATGGMIPGPDGAPQPILAHAGEWVLNKLQQGKVAGWLGMGVGKLRDSLGFTGGPESFAGGGEVQSPAWMKLARVDEDERHERRMAELKGRNHADERKAELDAHDRKMKSIAREEKRDLERYAKLDFVERRRADISHGQFTPRHLLSQTVPGVMGDVGDLFRATRRSARRGAESLTDRNLTQLTGEGGLLDQLSTAIDTSVSRMATNLARAAYTISRRGVVRETDATIALVREGENLEKTYGDLVGERGTITRGLRRVNQQLRAIRRGGVGERERERYENLVGEQRDLVGRRFTNRQDIADNLSSRYQNQLTRTQDAVDSITDRATGRTTLVDRFSRISSALGRTQDQPGIARERMQNAEQEILGLRMVLHNAQQMGQTDLAKGIQDSIDELRASVQETAIQMLQDEAAEVDRQAQRRNSALDIRNRVGAALGRVDVVAQVAQERIEEIQREIGDKQALKAKAEASGDQGLAERLGDEIADLTTQGVESAAQQIRDGVDQINQTAQRALSRADIVDRMLTATGSVSWMAPGARQAVFQQRESAIRAQGAGVVAMYQQAAAQGNVGLMLELQDQFQELVAALQENTRAAFQARIEDVNARVGYLNGINDLRAQIVNLQGELSGVVDTQRLRQLLEERTATLSNQRDQLAGLLNEARGIGDQQAINDLSQQMLENEVAMLENTKAIRELDGTLGQNIQSFSTTAWQLFRQAVFNGSGGLLPQYDIPMMDSGGTVKREGLAYLHAAEVVVPANQTHRGEGGFRDVNVNIEHPVEVADPVYLGNRIAWDLSSRGRR